MVSIVDPPVFNLVALPKGSICFFTQLKKEPFFGGAICQKLKSKDRANFRKGFPENRIHRDKNQEIPWNHYENGRKIFFVQVQS